MTTLDYARLAYIRTFVHYNTNPVYADYVQEKMERMIYARSVQELRLMLSVSNQRFFDKELASLIGDSNAYREGAESHNRNEAKGIQQK